MADAAQSAEDVRPFPPPTINRWVRYRTVSLESLIAELRDWADYYEVMQEEQRHHA